MFNLRNSFPTVPSLHLGPSCSSIGRSLTTAEGKSFLWQKGASASARTLDLYDVGIGGDAIEISLFPSELDNEDKTFKRDEKVERHQPTDIWRLQPGELSALTPHRSGEHLESGLLPAAPHALQCRPMSLGLDPYS